MIACTTASIYSEICRDVNKHDPRLYCYTRTGLSLDLHRRLGGRYHGSCYAIWRWSPLQRLQIVIQKEVRNQHLELMSDKEPSRTSVLQC